MAIALSALVFFLLLFVVLSWHYSNVLVDKYIHPVRRQLHKRPADFGLDYENLTFTSGDIHLAAWAIFPPGSSKSAQHPTVIAVHGYAHTRSDLLPRLAPLANAGYLVVVADLRGHGESGGELFSGGHLETADLVALTEQVRGLPFVDMDKIGYYGHSAGGAIAIMAAAERAEIRAVVADCAYANLFDIFKTVLRNRWLPIFPMIHFVKARYRKLIGVSMKEVSPVDAVKTFTQDTKLLLMTGGRDRITPAAHPRRIRDAFSNGAEYHFNPVGGHFDNGDARTIRDVVLPFLHTALLRG